jgi:uncharacterized membrane protein
MFNKDRSTINNVNPATHSKHDLYPKRNMGFVRTTIGVSVLVISLVLSACSSSANNPNPTSAPLSASMPLQTEAPTSASIPTATNTPQSTEAPTPAVIQKATSEPQQAAVNTPLDPCILISSQEASTLAAASFGQGKENTTPDGFRSCTYGSQTTNVFTVDVVQAPDKATAQADKAQFLADLQAQVQQLTDQGLNITELPNFADGAVMADASLNAGGATINGRAIGFLKGTVFFGFSDLVVGGAAPSSDAIQTEATTVLGRLP